MRNVVKWERKQKKTQSLKEKKITMTTTCNIVQTNLVVSGLGNAIYKQT